MNEDYLIKDNRDTNCFKTKTFSGFKKQMSLIQLLNLLKVEKLNRLVTGQPNVLFLVIL